VEELSYVLYEVQAGLTIVPATRTAVARWCGVVSRRRVGFDPGRQSRHGG
jgi:hypothetical protein